MVRNTAAAISVLSAAVVAWKGAGELVALGCLRVIGKLSATNKPNRC